MEMMKQSDLIEDYGNQLFADFRTAVDALAKNDFRKNSKTTRDLEETSGKMDKAEQAYKAARLECKAKQ